MSIKLRILGAAAGGGLPQWNCGCDNCNAAREGRIAPQTQSSVAVSGNGRDWAVLNASPDIRTQLAATPELHPTGLREMPLRSVLVTNGDIDHVAGLLVLRESQPFTLFATADIHGTLAANPVFDALRADCVTRTAVRLDQPFDLAPDLSATLFAVPGKVPLYLEGAEVETGLLGEQTVGVELRAGGRRAYYIPGCAHVPDWLATKLAGADLVMFDGTLWTDNEMIAAGLSQKTGQRMGHISISGPQGSMAQLARLNIAKKIFVHMNNSNPVLDPASPQTAIAQAQGWIIGRDGMEVSL
ncbi:pyrroloquinoline quinone biosynthesis protein PqqB [Thioclava sp. GXIMD4215]|uniref:pyrroloquinoline quinone biosynthesis protein PqqB n=1 Tax=Thioclava sp. GXIMD4215 TaxID=3131928 RepID=UPI00311ABED9